MRTCIQGGEYYMGLSFLYGPVQCNIHHFHPPNSVPTWRHVIPLLSS